MKSTGSLGWYAFSSRHPSLKVKVFSKNADWKDKFIFFRLPGSTRLRSRWNFSKISDRLDESLVVPGFDAVERFRRHRILFSSFSESSLVHASLSRAVISDDSESTSRSESSSDSGSQSRGISHSPLCFHTFFLHYYY